MLYNTWYEVYVCLWFGLVVVVCLLLFIFVYWLCLILFMIVVIYLVGLGLCIGRLLGLFWVFGIAVLAV